MKVLVDKQYLEKLKNLKPIANGKEGICYLQVDDNRIVKIFHEWNKSKKIYFDNLTNSQIAFPIDILYDKKDNLVGYTMHYLGGDKFINGFHEELSLQELKESYLKMRLIILQLKDIYMDDNCLENMLYDYNLKRINLIDTSRWYEKIDGHIESINEFNWQMITALLRNIDFKHYKINHDKKLFELYMTYQYFEQIPSLFLEFLNELELKVSEYKGYKVKTINDLLIK